MKKALKIFGITLGCIIGVVVMAIGIAVWVVFTPERLTPIVRNVAREYVACEHTLGEVDLTFFSTFPRFGLSIDSVVVVNPIEGAPSDTVVSIPHMVVSVDVMALLNKQTLSIPTLTIADIEANIFVDADGQANYDVLLSGEAEGEEAEDTTTTALPFEQIQVDGLHLSARSLCYVSLADSMNIALQGARVDAQVAEWNDMLLALELKSLDAVIGGETLAQGLRLSAHMPAAVDMQKMRITLRQAQLAVNNLAVALDGWAEMGDDIQTDIRMTLEDWQVDSVMPLLPISLDKEIAALMKGGAFSLDAQAAIHMGDSSQSVVTIHQASADMQLSHIRMSGKVKDPLGKLSMDIASQVDIQIEDVHAFLPDDMQAAGQIKGLVQVQMDLDDLTNMQLHKGHLAGDLQLHGIYYQADGMQATLPESQLQFQIPNPTPSRKEVAWIAAKLKTHGGTLDMQPTMAVELGKTHLALEASNILSDNPWLYATLSLDGREQLRALMDSMDMTIAQPNVKAYVAYHMQDTSVMPVLDAEIAFDRAQGYYTDIQVDIQPSQLSAKLQAPRLQASLQTQALVAQIGEEMQVKTGQVAMSAAARYNKRGGDNLLLKWNPQLSVDMHEAEVALSDWEKKISIPTIDFTYTNRDCKIEQSKIVIGNSDFALTGELKNIGRWMRNKAVLEGELTFESEKTDVDELLALLSADEGSEEETSLENAAEPLQDGASASLEDEEAKSETTEPFLVPTNVDLTLNTRIKEAHVMNQVARNLGGKVYVKDGILVIEEMGFICNAAKLQLTAMYRTPRRNHIYVGLDYHMIDINIQELISMIPQLDTMMPMLSAFRGEAEFHLAAETYTNAQYELKPSTLRGAASIYGKDLVVLDNETFSKISKLLLFSKKTENKVDSISAEMTVYKKEIDVYPFCVSMDNYMVALGGRHNLDMSFNYDVNVLSPIYLGVNVSGNLDDLDIKLAPCKFAKDFKPRFNRKVDTHSAELRSMIRESMRKNVRIEE